MHRFRHEEPGSWISDYLGLYLHGAVRDACQCRKNWEFTRKRSQRLDVDMGVNTFLHGTVYHPYMSHHNL